MDGGILRCFSANIVCLCIVPLTPTVMVMRGSIAHLAIVSSGLYLSRLSHVIVSMNLSWQWVNLITFMVFVEEG